MLIKNFVEYEKIKDIFLIFTDQFKLLDITQLKSDLVLLKYHRDTLKNSPGLYSYIYQTALSAVYHERRFSRESLLEAFDYKFKCYDSYGLNNGLCDVSDVNTAFILHHMATKTPFKESSLSLESGPLSYKTATYYSIQASMKKTIEDNRYRTGNTNPDLRIDNRPYDIKHEAHDRIKQNLILPWEHKKFIDKIESHFKNMHKEITMMIDNTPSTPNIAFFYKAEKQLAIIIDKKNTTSWEEKNEMWQKFIVNNSGNIPPNFNFSIVIKINDFDYPLAKPKYMRENVNISPDTLEHPAMIRETIAEMLTSFGPNVARKASIATNHGLPFDKNFFDTDIET